MVSARCWLTVVVAIGFCHALIGAEPRLLPREVLEAGWIQLFDGETFYGWQPVGDADWEVVDGEIRTRGERPGFLMTTTRWAYYQLDLEFRASEKTNSGVFLRTPLQPTDPASDCYELNIAPVANPFPTGSVVARKKASLPASKFPDPDEWHKFEIIMAPAEMSVVLDGAPIIRLPYGNQPIPIGYIGLQSREGPVAFRNIRLLPMGLIDLFNGRDLTGWNTERAENSEFAVTEAGELQIINGPGQIETEREFANFVLQLECKVNGDGLNSGIFFRTLRTGRWTGYESQIHNGYKEGDRTKPADFGTGGIYRRQPARRVVPSDREWFTKTVVADGPHFAVWVNSYQVSDWTDTRPPHESPREGLRLGPGLIAIQGHDPTTNLQFRKLRAAELPR